MVLDKDTAELGEFLKQTRGNSADARGHSPQGIVPTTQQVVFGDIGMFISSDGVWHYKGTPINRPALLKFFASILQKDNAGNFWLITPTEIAPVTVEDTPFVAIDLALSGKGAKQNIRLITNIETSIIIDAKHPLILLGTDKSKQALPYVLQPNGLHIRLNRAVYYDVVALGIEKKRKITSVFGIWSGGVFHELGQFEPENTHGFAP
ncbi:MAG: hypothetical protein CBB68_14230 [Rhodospirillaceae bacterium TMED8]|nr:proteophosphoglycan precursor [Magnetovibrio sp.]OUT48116.1 MAG: hypothetical protein CBB68_14230 [Rhodospirillaceae bacterium TMED8]|tara:strand:+ start:387 stop:1007 length:621 start_codon:yes stop_codon:yes gene_type:complete